MDQAVVWFLDAVKALGVAGGPLMGVLWWLERTERQASQDEARTLTVHVLTVASQTATAVVEITRAVAEMGDSSRETTKSLTALGNVIRTLGRERR